MNFYRLHRSGIGWMMPVEFGAAFGEEEVGELAAGMIAETRCNESTHKQYCVVYWSGHIRIGHIAARQE
ncbi:hypothetical protein [Mycobacterium intracellulare]|uniref:Uncharacterized protein n=1 Tax=Mycobacterium intracellulare TaxID=1767 RepID=A0AAE4RA57_MYCIT|nr:hypothetical protein [Mycobacterium intracellulare]MDV6977059.1 hypothetical protein [Mycobacterium intracellulare]MDV6982356.1 hypothetical protein [Mycobacterium intracellulare]MDV7011860.1 hypothetical protein [Mycobacterium intracellulare]MDV7026796.1 hypothetical protein [Mycobacterium intracellulare]